MVIKKYSLAFLFLIVLTMLSSGVFADDIKPNISSSNQTSCYDLDCGTYGAQKSYDGFNDGAAGHFTYPVANAASDVDPDLYNLTYFFDANYTFTNFSHSSGAEEPGVIKVSAANGSCNDNDFVFIENFTSFSGLDAYVDNKTFTSNFTASCIRFGITRADPNYVSTYEVWFYGVEDIDRQADINITTTSPETGESFSLILLEINTTIESNETINISLYLNNTINQTLENVSPGSNISESFNLSFGASEQVSYAYIIEASAGFVAENSSAKTFYVDNVNPIILDNQGVNLSVVYQDFFVNFSFSDPYLYSYNISYCGSEDYNGTLGGVTSVEYSEVLDTSSCSDGENILTTTITDGHTARFIPEYNSRVSSSEKSIIYDFGVRGSVNIKPVRPNDYFLPRTSKKFDRYDFSFFRVGIPSFSEEFYVESEGYIDIIDHDDYKGWLVLPMEGKWIDFENSEASDVQVVRIADNKVLVRVYGLISSDIVFNSIGDLNVVEVNYTFYSYNLTQTYVEPLLEGEQTVYSLNISGFTPNTSAFISINGTEYVATKVSGSGFDYYTYDYQVPVGVGASIEHFWNYTIFGAVNNLTNVTSPINQTVQTLDFDNCTTYSMISKVFSLFNETSEGAVSGDIDAHMTVWTNNVSQNKSFNISWAGNQSHFLCLSPNSTNATANMHLDYSSSGFDSNTYYFENTNLDNVSETVNLYLSDISYSLVEFIVVDQDDNELEGALIYVLKYDIGTDSTITSEILRTGTDGTAVGHILLNTQFYKFIISYNGQVYLETNELKITTSPKTFRIDLLEDYFENYDVVQGVSCSLSYTNATTTFSFTYSDPTSSIGSGCLSVVRRTVSGDTVVNDTCSSSTTGTISVNINGTTLGTATYIGTGYILLDGTPYVCGDSIANSFNYDYEIYGESGMFVSFLMTLFLIMLGIANPVLGIFGCVIGVTISVLLGFYHLSWSALVSFIIICAIAMYTINKR